VVPDTRVGAAVMPTLGAVPAAGVGAVAAAAPAEGAGVAPGDGAAAELAGGLGQLWCLPLCFPLLPL